MWKSKLVHLLHTTYHKPYTVALHLYIQFKWFGAFYAYPGEKTIHRKKFQLNIQHQQEIPRSPWSPWSSLGCFKFHNVSIYKLWTVKRNSVSNHDVKSKYLYLWPIIFRSLEIFKFSMKWKKTFTGPLQDKQSFHPKNSFTYRWLYNQGK